ncbi:hypothetical protein FBY40_0982 [Microbacterium sp. SLBN-154]|uniref:hypothetical protein n=1 Tax=Microbacterium sp. SLBN-154 TaxID=2768458 RepID=UPI0011531144|nr:hypothetical protein [Microbacterium sp. SLBN-154]TQK18495.1 hypothetical protein FBY40_0982 [Microbacterium sp. SLBN-154]
MGPHRRAAAGAASSALALTLALALTGCGPAPWDFGAEPTPSTTTSSTPSAAPTPVPNDLSSGSTERELVAGAVAASVDYWSNLSMDRWTAEALKPVSLSMTTTVTPDDGQKVYLQRAVMVAVPQGPDGAMAPLEAQVDQSSVAPGYLVLAPYSYSQTFNVGSVPTDATHVQLQFSYDFLVQTTPTSNEFAKQTASDTVTVAIAAAPGSESDPEE